MRILLAIDDSECSRAATNSVITQFLPHCTLVHVLHANEPHTGVSPETAFADRANGSDHVAGAHDSRRRAAAALVAAVVDELESAGFATVASIRDGNPRDAILSCAKDWRADLIVVGSHGRKGVNRMVMGSVSDDVARHARCSVEIVRAPSAVAL